MKLISTIDVPNSHWLVDEKRGVWFVYPFNNRKMMMVYQTGPSIFTKRTLLISTIITGVVYFKQWTLQCGDHKSGNYKNFWDFRMISHDLNTFNQQTTCDFTKRNCDQINTSWDSNNNTCNHIHKVGATNRSIFSKTLRCMNDFSDRARMWFNKETLDWKILDPPSTFTDWYVIS